MQCGAPSGALNGVILRAAWDQLPAGLHVHVLDCRAQHGAARRTRSHSAAHVVHPLQSASGPE